MSIPMDNSALVCIFRTHLIRHASMIKLQYDVIEDVISSIEVTRGGRRSPAVACWASDHWVASSNPLRGKFRH